jgi:calcineurin-like phosphoesterase family protein
MSGQIRFISDLHLGHQNMATRRGFKDYNEMNNFIIKKWNETVKKHDVTYILGDVTMERKHFYPLLDELKGIKKVILGNHDRPQDVPELLKYVNWVGGMYEFKDKMTESDVFLTHAPVHPQELEYRINFNIHGHVHENSLPDNRYLNVSAEVIDYTPKTFEELLKIYL